MQPCCWDSTETKIEYLQAAEATLLDFAKQYGERHPDSYELITEDTPISYQTLPLKRKKREKQAKLYMHAVVARAKHFTSPPPPPARPEKSNQQQQEEEESTEPASLSSAVNGSLNGSLNESSGRLLFRQPSTRRTSTPLVLLHGYMNGALYFYRNLVGLTSYFETIYSLDMLGCGLSSRRQKLAKSDLLEKSVAGTESLFVESIEAWRRENGISKMILGGHSLGGYIGVAYCERYPQYVERLVLLSPAGVTHPDMEQIRDWRRGLSWSERLSVSFGKWIFESGVTPGTVMRAVTTARGKNIVRTYIRRRMPEIEPDQQQAISDYLYYNAILPGSGEYMLNRFLTAWSHARVPTVDRIPKLKVPDISFLYGETDWMETDGGVEVLEKTKMMKQERIVGGGGTVREEEEEEENFPTVDVFEVKDAGHLLMLDNWKGFHGGLITICGGSDTLSPDFPAPAKRIHIREERRSLYVANYKNDIKQTKQRSAANSAASSQDSSLGSA